MAENDPVTPRKKRGRTATTPEEREKQLQNLAYDLAEKQLINGSASSQVISQLLKGGGSREQLELEKLRHDNDLLVAKIGALETAGRIEEKIEAAIEAFRRYTGDTPLELEE